MSKKEEHIYEHFSIERKPTPTRKSDDFDTADQELKEVHEGDLLIYDSKCLVLFYENFETTYQYTPLGKISDTAGLKEALGTGTATISFQTALEKGIL